VVAGKRTNTFETSVTGRLVEISAQFCPNIAQNGALVKEVLPKEISRNIPNLELIKVNFGRFFENKIPPKSFGRYFLDKNAPDGQKYRSNSEITPNLVTVRDRPR
jgi:hypothetical protein